MTIITYLKYFFRKIVNKCPRGKIAILWVYTIALTIISTYFFNQVFDMSLTTWHTHDFLNCLYQGKITSFYSIVADRAANGGYFNNGINSDAASYNPVMYIVMAIVILPVYLLFKLIEFDYVGLAYSEVIRVFMIGYSIWAAVLCAKIANRITGKTIQNTPIYYLSSPIFILCTLICNQYDVLAVIVCLYALLFYNDKKYIRFALLVGIAACMKPFALIMYFPLILIVEKKLLKLLLNFLVALAPFTITSLIPYIVDPGYKYIIGVRESNFGFTDSIFETIIPGGLADISIFIISYCIICAIAYLITTNGENIKINIFLAFVSYICFFSFVNFHIQWLIYLLPFFTILVLTAKNINNLLIMEICFTGTFMITAHMKTTATLLLIHSNFVHHHPEISFSIYDDMNFYRHIIPSLSIPFSLMVGFGIAFIITYLAELKNSQTDDTTSLNVDPQFSLLLIRSSLILLYIVPSIYSLFSYT
ncbi:MAG: hypothetical protein MJ093_08975 [Saccharofermentans sp.]|nr:hypothetical protein [Saccharofermentans sp.]